MELNINEFLHNAIYVEKTWHDLNRASRLFQREEELRRVAKDRLRWLDDMFGTGLYLCGERFTAADIWFYVRLDFGQSVNQPLDHNLLNINPWFERIAA